MVFIRHNAGSKSIHLILQKNYQNISFKGEVFKNILILNCYTYTFKNIEIMEFQKILIGIDDSKYADNAARYGFELAHKFNARVALVHIVEPVIVTTPVNDTSMMGSLIPSISTGVEEVEIANIQEQFSQKLISDTIAKYGENLQITQFSEYGSTAEALVECAAQFNADLIVIGTHSRTGLDRFLMGSIAESIVRHSPVAVLVVPLTEEKEA